MVMITPRLGPLGINQGTRRPTKPQNTPFETHLGSTMATGLFSPGKEVEARVRTHVTGKIWDFPG